MLAEKRHRRLPQCRLARRSGRLIPRRRPGTEQDRLRRALTLTRHFNLRSDEETSRGYNPARQPLHKRVAVTVALLNEAPEPKA